MEDTNVCLSQLQSTSREGLMLVREKSESLLMNRASFIYPECPWMFPVRVKTVRRV